MSQSEVSVVESVCKTPEARLLFDAGYKAASAYTPHPDEFVIRGRNGRLITPIGIRKGRPVYSHEDVDDMEPRYSENRCNE